jgi:hypothetical protein
MKENLERSDIYKKREKSGPLTEIELTIFEYYSGLMIDSKIKTNKQKFFNSQQMLNEGKKNSYSQSLQ